MASVVGPWCFTNIASDAVCDQNDRATPPEFIPTAIYSIVHGATAAGPVGACQKEVVATRRST